MANNNKRNETPGFVGTQCVKKHLNDFLFLNGMNGKKWG